MKLYHTQTVQEAIAVFYYFPKEYSHFKECAGHNPMSKWEMDFDRR
ncbi:hypothetical protein ACFOU2_16080 [Bacillus songklensis]|uniref:Uncharacterized protein n=1 Tax=Bacillus songklensis TaxID=1069116 RepID=A0ABV8B421_9BACI